MQGEVLVCPNKIQAEVTDESLVLEPEDKLISNCIFNVQPFSIVNAPSSN